MWKEGDFAGRDRRMTQLHGKIRRIGMWGNLAPSFSRSSSDRGLNLLFNMKLASEYTNCVI